MSALTAHQYALHDPVWHQRLGWSAAMLVLLIPALWLTEFKPWIFFDQQSLRAGGSFIKSFWPPAHDAEFFRLLISSTWNTIAVATTGVTLGLIIAVPAALIGNRVLSVSALAHGRMGVVGRAVRGLMRAVLIVLRSIPELVWGLIFVRAVGLGDTAGVLAIALTFGGMMGKVFLEVFESVDRRATLALLNNGSSRLAAFLYGTLPTCAPELASYLVFRWECAIRSSVILGFVGAGGLGQQMELSMKMLAGGEVVMFLLAFVALVSLADLVSKRLRRWMQ
jgi:phosphonate transport system permease protein